MECITELLKSVVPMHTYVIVYDGAIVDPFAFAQENGGQQLQPRGSLDLER